MDTWQYWAALVFVLAGYAVLASWAMRAGDVVRD